jgi:hypothetical protein
LASSFERSKSFASFPSGKTIAFKSVIGISFSMISVAKSELKRSPALSPSPARFSARITILSFMYLLNNSGEGRFVAPKVAIAECPISTKERALFVPSQIKTVSWLLSKPLANKVFSLTPKNCVFGSCLCSNSS